MKRKPAVAGSFYPHQPERLSAMIEGFLEDVPRQKALGVLSPHAGYVYSGPVAGALFSRVEIPKSVLILAPNHQGIGASFALYPSGSWEMPLGEVQIDEDLNRALLSASSILEEDAQAHSYEHSAEVQVPFLQHQRGDLSISAIVMLDGEFSTLERLGKDIASSVRNLGKEVLIVASSDMTHYEPQRSASEKDRMAIDEIQRLDAKGLYDAVSRNRISMCGVHPATVMIIAAKELGASEAELIKYQTSGDVTGDYDQVVGYAGIIVK